MDATQFLNVDLEMIADVDLAPFLAQVASQVVVLRDSIDGPTRTVWLELDAEPEDMDDAVRRYVALIEALPAAIRELWDACSDRCLNVGIQAGQLPHAAEYRMSPASVAGVARIRAGLEVTVYGTETPQDDGDTPTES